MEHHSVLNIKELYRRHVRFLTREEVERCNKADYYAGHFCFHCGRITPHLTSSQVRFHIRRNFKSVYSRACSVCGVYLRAGHVRKRLSIYALDRKQCVYCGQKDNLSLDHYVPRAKEGSSTVNNLVIACIGCNHSKAHHDAPPLIYGRFQEFGT